MVNNFRHACVVVSNLGRALRFYRDILGLKVSKTLTVKGRFPERVLGKKGISLTYVKMGARKDSPKLPPTFELHCWHKPGILPGAGYNHVSFTVGDIAYEYKRLSGKGVKFISGPVRSKEGKTKICFAYDPDGNLIEFVEDLKKKRLRRND